MESVVLTVARPRPVAVATSPAVIASSVASAARTALLVAPEAVRAGEVGGLVELGRLFRVADTVLACFADAVAAGEADVVAERFRLRPLLGDAFDLAARIGSEPSCEPSEARA